MEWKWTGRLIVPLDGTDVVHKACESHKTCVSRTAHVLLKAEHEQLLKMYRELQEAHRVRKLQAEVDKQRRSIEALKAENDRLTRNYRQAPIYRDRDGGLYRKLGEGRASATLGELPCVIYESAATGDLWVLETEDFHERFTLEDGEKSDA